MIDFRFSIQNPWHNAKKHPWRDLYQGHVVLTKHKTFEWAIDYHTWDWFEFSIDTRWRGTDHAGPELRIRLFGLGVELCINDNRHWNDNTNTWVNYDNPEEVKKW